MSAAAKDRRARDIGSRMGMDIGARWGWVLSGVCWMVPGCTQTAAVADSLGGGGTAGEGGDASDGSTGPGATGSTPDDDDDNDDDDDDDADSSGGGNEPVYDVGVGETGGPMQQCEVGDDIDGIGSCDAPPLSESFNAEVQWSWTGGDTGRSYVTPLVGNLTDDNDDGSVDLCDTPDIVVVATGVMGPSDAGTIVVLSGNSNPGGDVHWQYGQDIAAIFNPALGDIDDDGLMEIVAVEATGNPNEYRLIALSNEGELEWAADPHPALSLFGHIALADMDADGDVEIMAGGLIADHEGNEVTVIPGLEDSAASGFAVDLDDDGDLEYVHPRGAHHHDGTLYFSHDNAASLVFPQVADIDGDEMPEILYANYDSGGMAIYEHNGTLKVDALMPSLSGLPAAMHDMNGDGQVDMAGGNGSYSDPYYGVIEFDGSEAWEAWSVSVQGGCCASGTAFDFLGDATAEAMFADDYDLYIFGEDGEVLTSAPRRSSTGTDYPVVADVDNDGSAEIIVVAAEPSEAPALQVIRDEAEGWVQARRIWNQHAYHVTNVREDGTIPMVQPKNWRDLNTFRTQAQISADGVCVPEG